MQHLKEWIILIVKCIPKVISAPKKLQLTFVNEVVLSCKKLKKVKIKLIRTFVYTKNAYQIFFTKYRKGIGKLTQGHMIKKAVFDRNAL